MNDLFLFMSCLAKQENREGRYILFSQLSNLEGIYQKNERELKFKLHKAQAQLRKFQDS